MNGGKTLKRGITILILFKSKWGDRPKGIKIFFYIYMLGFLAGTVSHIIDIWHGGFMPYNSSPLLLNVYWTSLTFFDPLAIFLLFYFPYAGMALAVFIMISDIAVNLYVTYVFNHGDIFSSWILVSQILFGLFVFITVPVAWKRLKHH